MTTNVNVTFYNICGDTNHTNFKFNIENLTMRLIFQRVNGKQSIFQVLEVNKRLIRD